METILCQNDGSSCFGCCGRDYESVDEIKADVKRQTQELFQIKNLISFRNRFPSDELAASGICQNAVEKDGKIICPLHPALNEGKDLRIGHCDTNYWCETMRKFRNWSEEKRQRFLAFLKEKQLNNYTYSLGIDSGKFLKEFEDSYN